MPYTPPPDLRNLSFDDIARLAQQRNLPPVEQWHPKASSDSKMQILSDGRWFHDGSEIKRKSMIRAFSSLLRKDEDGYWLVTPYEKQSIIVDDSPFIAVEMHSNGDAKTRNISMRLNTDDIIAINKEHPILLFPSGTDHIPYILVRQGLYAKCTRSITYELYDIGIKEQNLNTDNIVIWSDGECFSLEVKS